MAHFSSHAPGSFCLFELCTTDLTAAKAFYTSLFGWMYGDNPASPVGIYTMFRLGDVDVAGGYARGQNPYWDIYVSVESADVTAGKAAQLGGKVIKAPFDVATYGRMAVIGDPTGGVICVWEAKSHIGIRMKNEPGSFCWADLATPDPEAAANFYTGLFGWTLVPGAGGYLHVKNSDDFIGGIRKAEAGEHTCWLSYVQVAYCAASTAQARELGAKVFVEPMSIGTTGSMSVIADPQGAVLALFEMAEGSV